MKKILFFLMLLIVVAGAAGATLFFLKIGPFEEAPDPNARPEEEFLENPDIAVVEIKPFTIPMFQGERIAGSIKVQFKLEVKKDQEEFVNEKMTRLEDAYLSDLYVYLPRLLRNSENLNIIALKRRLTHITEKVLGPDVLENILIQTVADAPG